MPRPKLEPALTHRIVDLIRAGNFLEIAAAAAGVHRTTLHRWLRLGRDQKRGKYRKFAESVDRAHAECESRDVALIAKAATQDWRASAWLIERRAPRRYDQRVQVSVQEELEAVLDRLERKLAPELYEQVLQAMVSEDDDLPRARDVTPSDALVPLVVDGG